MEKNKKLRIKAASILIAAVTAALFVSCSRGGKAEPPRQAEEKKAVKARVMTLEPRDFTKRLTLSGSSKASSEVTVAAEAGGRIARIGFEKGDRVKAGAPLAWLDDSSAKAELAQAEAGRDLAALEHRKLKALEERKAGVSEFQLEQARLNLNSAEARVAAVKALLTKFIVNAPISGVLVTREVETGAIIAPGQPISRLISTDPMKIAAGMPEMAIADFHSGLTATARFDAFPEREYEGKITFISPAVNSVTRTFDMEVTIWNHDAKIFPDMSAKVEFPWRHVKNAMLIPQSATVELTDGHAVFVVDGGVARQRRVELEDVSGDMALVKSGVKAGDVLVVTGQRSMVDGDLVEISEK
jgi:membrane fusion protein (multidrug efflux system)